MTPRPEGSVWFGLLFAVSLALGGCSTLPGSFMPSLASSQASADPAAVEFDEAAAMRRRLETEPMTQTDLELYFGSLVDAIEGPPGALRTQVQGVEVFLISDPKNDQMRLAVRVAQVAGLPPRFLRILLQSNFDETGYARYAISNGVVFATYLHRISTLTPSEIELALTQVVQLQKTFGTTFSSEPEDSTQGLR